MGKFTESVLGVEVFNWNGWDVVDTGTLQYYEVEFLIEELTEHNGDVACVTMNMGGDIEIYDEAGASTRKLNLGELKSFREKLNKRWEEIK